MPLLTNEIRDAIVDDLLLRHPKGPVHRRHDAVPSEQSSKQWGYTDFELFNLGFRNEQDVEKYVLARWFTNRSRLTLGRRYATVTRRMNRLWYHRLEAVVSRVRTNGGDGIYIVKAGQHISNSRELGHIYASSKPEALRFAEMFFSYILSSSSSVASERLFVDFVRFGSPAEVIQLNAQTLERSAKQLTEWRAIITRYQKQIEAQMICMDTLRMVEEQQLSAEVSEENVIATAV